MSLTLEATFDGAVFRPDTSIDLEPSTKVKITVETVESKKEPYSFLRYARSLKLEGPADFSTQLDYYLYGVERSDE